MILFIVFDGLRPDQVTPSATPALWDLAGRGVRFLNHHSVYPTLTRVNVASMFTGCYPTRHGVVGNTIYRPDVDPTWEISTGSQPDIVRLQGLIGRGIVSAPTLGEVLHGHGETMTATGVGSNGNTFLHHPEAASVGGAIAHPEFTVPDSLAAELLDRFGPWPKVGIPNHNRIERAVTVLLEYLLPVYEPAVATIWMSDPDGPHHLTGIGSSKSVDSIRLADAQLARIVSALDNLGTAETTDILVVSDHGHSTVKEVVDVRALLVDAGLKDSEESTDVLVADNGGSVLIYMPGADDARVVDVCRFLMGQPWSGPLFSRVGPTGAPGTLGLAAAGYDHPSSPDILLSFAWGAEPNRHGIKGRIYSCGDNAVGHGNHGSASPYEVHNTLIAAGPHFKSGLVSMVPSSNVDLFPTILRALELEIESPVDGRVLDEALVGGPEPEEVFFSTEVREESTDLGDVTYRQKVQFSRVGGASYLDKGTAYREKP